MRYFTIIDIHRPCVAVFKAVERIADGKYLECIRYEIEIKRDHSETNE